MHEHEREERPSEAHPETAEKDGGKKGEKKGSVVRNLIVGLVAAVVVIAAVAVAIFSLGLYKYGWEGPLVQKVTSVLPYPAAKVNGEPIRYSEFLLDVATLDRYFESQVAEGVSPDTLPSAEEIKTNALDRLVYITVLGQEARARGIEVSQDDIDKEFETIVAQGGDEQSVLAEIEQLYGWTADMFKQKVVRPYILQDKVGKSLMEDPALLEPARQEAESVLQQLKEGADFDQMAAEHSDDYATSLSGGDLGIFGKGVMVPAFEEAAFALDEGELSDIVQTPYGFHIIRVDVVDEEDGEKVRVGARHILIMPVNVEAFLQEKVDNADIVSYVNP